jgi:hypothetical protein
MTEPQEDSAPDLKELQGRLSSLEQRNQAGMESIGQMGAQLDPASLMFIRLNSFIGFVFQRLGSSSPEIRQILTTLFEIEYQERLAETLAEVRAEVRKASLGVGGSMSMKDMKRMWREQQNGKGQPIPPGLIGG